MRFETALYPEADPETTKQEIGRWTEHAPERGADLADDVKNIKALFTVQSIAEDELSVRGEEIARVPRHLTVAGHRFEIGEEPLGSGGFGVVYEARLARAEVRPSERTRAAPESEEDAALERAVQEVAAEEGKTPASIVLKFVIEGLSEFASPAAIQKEAAAWSAHGGLVDGRRFQTESGATVSVLALERAPGKNLGELTRDATWDRGTPRASFELMAALRSYVKQLKSLKERGWTSHNDVKPQNLMLARERGIARLIDLGLARRKEDDERLREQGSREISGTLQYMSPVALTGQLDPTGDTHALGLSIAEVWGTMRGVAESVNDITRGTGIESPVLTEENYGAVFKEQFPRHMSFASERDFGYLLYEMVLPHADVTMYRETRERSPLPLERVLARTNEILRDHIAFLTVSAARDELRRRAPDTGSREQELLADLEAALAGENLKILRALADKQEVKQLRRAALRRR